MRRLPVVLLSLLLGAAVLSACTVDVGPYAARVNGTTISRATLTDALNAVAHDRALRCIVATNNQQGGKAAIEGTGAGTFDSTFAAEQLTSLIKRQALDDELGRLGITVGPAGTELAAQRLATQFAAQGSQGTGCQTSGTQILSQLTPAYRSLLVALEADQDAIAAHLAGTTLTPGGLDAYASSHAAAVQLDCVSAILTQTLAAAQRARAAIEHGASFATVAKQDSIDQTSAQAGGAIGCHQASAFASPLNTVLASLPLGAVSEPLSFSGSYVLLTVTSHARPSAADVLDYLVSQATTSANRLVNGSLARAKVEVDPRYGRWASVSGSWQVVPPTGPANSDLSNPAAVSPTPISIG